MAVPGGGNLSDIIKALFVGQDGSLLSQEDLATQRLALAKRSGATDTSPVGHWTQGAARMLDALGDRFERSRLDDASKAMAAEDKSVLSQIMGSFMGGGAPSAPAQGGGVQPAAQAGSMSSAGTVAADPSASYNAQGGLPSFIGAQPSGPTTNAAYTFQGSQPGGSPGASDPAMIKAGLVSRGIPEHVADGMLVNMRDESGFNSGINEKNPTVPGSRGGFGLMQWTGPRRRELEAFASARGVAPSDVNAQLDFLKQELGSTEKAAAARIMSARNASEAAISTARHFLRPAESNLNKRVAQYQNMQGPSPVDQAWSGVTQVASAPASGSQMQAQSAPQNMPPQQQPSGIMQAIDGDVMTQALNGINAIDAQLTAGNLPPAQQQALIQHRQQLAAAMQTGAMPSGAPQQAMQQPQAAAMAAQAPQVMQAAQQASVPQQPMPEGYREDLYGFLSGRPQQAMGATMSPAAAPQQPMQATPASLGQSATVNAPTRMPTQAVATQSAPASSQAPAASPAQASIQRPNNIASLLSASTNPRLSEGTRSIAKSLLTQQMGVAQKEAERARTLAEREQAADVLKIPRAYAQNEEVWKSAVGEHFKTQTAAPGSSLVRGGQIVGSVPHALMNVAPNTTVLDPNTNRPVFTAPSAPTTEQMNDQYAQQNPGFRDRQAQSKFNEASQNSQIKFFESAQTAGASARSNLAQINQLDNLLGQSPAGAAANMVSLAGRVGIDLGKDTTNVQAANAIISRLVPAQREPGSGPMSDKDIDLFRASLPQLINTREGNQKIIATMRGIAQYDEQRGVIANRVFNGELTPAQGRDALMSLPNPLAEYSKPADGGGWEDKGGGVRMRVKQ